MSSVGSVSFKGSTSSILDAVNPREWAQQVNKEKDLKSELLKQMPNSIKLLDKMKNFVGEVPNIIINAVGTGLVAPVFIKYNPLSKTDEDTRTYSAWRQPVSAALAVLTQAGLVIPFNSVINNMTNSGDFFVNKYNRTAYQDLKYIEKTIKKENPNLSKEEISKLAKDKQYKQLENIIEQLYNKDTIEYTTKRGVVKLSKDEIKELMEQTAQDMLVKAKDNPHEKAVIKEMQDAIRDNKSVKDVHKIASNISNVKFAYDAAQKFISNTAANIKGMKQITGLAVSLAILPVTCCLLNYVYPKFMKAFFPNLSDKKQEKPQDTFVKNSDAPKDDEQEVRK